MFTVNDKVKDVCSIVYDCLIVLTSIVNTIKQS